MPLARQASRSTTSTTWRTRRAVAPSVGFSETPARLAPSCLRGEHNAAILTELGYAADDVASFKADQVVFPPEPPG